MKKAGRNDPCPCGSGKKFKQCCANSSISFAPATPLQPSNTQNIQLAIQHHQVGQLDEAQSIYQRILATNPNHPDALHLLGLIAHQRGQHQLAVELITKAISFHPSAPMFCNLGAAWQSMGNMQEAQKCLKKALQLQPNYADAYNNLGNVILSQGDSIQSVEYFLKAIELNPQHVDAINNLGNAYKDIGKLEEAIACYRKALNINPQYADAMNNLGVALHSMGKLNEAIECYQHTLKLRPDDSGAWNNMGSAYLAQRNLQEASSCYSKAILINPKHIEAYSNFGLVLQATGELEAAIESFRHALKINPGYSGAHSNLIFVMDMNPQMSVEALQGERRQWNLSHAKNLLPTESIVGCTHAEKKLRLGYVSGDFRKHSAFHVFCHMLTGFDRENFEVFAYSNCIFEDDCTNLIQSSCSGWRNIAGMSDESVSNLIKKDQIDILIDLSGFTEGNRLLTFARKPAPIQITAWGYIGGTGMKAMDYFFADQVVVPPEEKSLYAEEVIYLPNVVCYQAFEPFPPVNTLPALASGNVTFGSFNRLIKVTQETFDVWAKVLKAIPDSRIILKTPELDDIACRNRVMATFIQLGITPDRITLQGKTSWSAHMAAFDQIDISLDPFPHGGGVTTLEGIMMGVPVVTLRWPTIPGRISAAVLTPLGLTDWIAETSEQYVDIAITKVDDLQALAVLRKQLRKTMTSSLVGNPKAYVREVENIYRHLWIRCCQS